MEEFCQRVYARVDLDAIVWNMERMRERLPKETRMLGVVKADAYGHGAVPVARRLEALPYLAGFAVAAPEEAFELREGGIRKPILVLGYSFPCFYERMAREEIRPTVFDEDSIGALEEAARRTGKPVRVHIKVDTGMNRIGVKPDESGLSFVKALSQGEGIVAEGIFTHFARADEAKLWDAERQLGTFRQFIHRIEEELGFEIPVKHCANSAAVLRMPGACMNLVRAGIAMYGMAPSPETDGEVPLRPALSLHSRVVYVKTIEKGQSVSYGGTFTAERRMRVATISAGYGDGYPRGLSGRGYVLLHGKRAPVLGRVCMDQFMVDVSGIPETSRGDEAVLLGADGGERISAELLGELSGRFHYELVCCLGKRIPRIYEG